MPLINDTILSAIINLNDETQFRIVLQVLMIIMCVLFLYNNTEAKNPENKLRKFRTAKIAEANNMNYFLEQNSPNPFEDSTTISYSIPEKCHVILEIYNDKVMEVVKLIDEIQECGEYTIPFLTKIDGMQLPEGIYFYRLKAGHFVDVKKMIITR